MESLSASREAGDSSGSPSFSGITVSADAATPQSDSRDKKLLGRFHPAKRKKLAVPTSQMNDNEKGNFTSLCSQEHLAAPA
jgi:hypothetical protein